MTPAVRSNLTAEQQARLDAELARYSPAPATGELCSSCIQMASRLSRIACTSFEYLFADEDIVSSATMTCKQAYL